jgi:hypothetical protein
MYFGFAPLLQPYAHHLPSDFGSTVRALKQRDVPSSLPLAKRTVTLFAS